MIEEKILNYKEFMEHKIILKTQYENKTLQEKYKIKRILYRQSKMSENRKDYIWDYLNGMLDLWQ